MKTIKKCKFKIGDKVYHKPDLYGMTESKVIEIHKTFQEEPHSLRYIDRDISSTRKELNARIEIIDGLPYYIHDELKTPHYTIKACLAPFAGYAISTENEKMRTLWMERNLKLV